MGKRNMFNYIVPMKIQYLVYFICINTCSAFLKTHCRKNIKKKRPISWFSFCTYSEKFSSPFYSSLRISSVFLFLFYLISVGRSVKISTAISLSISFIYPLLKPEGNFLSSWSMWQFTCWCSGLPLRPTQLRNSVLQSVLKSSRYFVSTQLRN